jgi:hypothetical protein
MGGCDAGDFRCIACILIMAVMFQVHMGHAAALTAGNCVASWVQSARAAGSHGFGLRSWRLQRADAWPRWLLRGSRQAW